MDTLPPGIERRDCPGCHGTGANAHAFEGICGACSGVGTVTVEVATGNLARLVRCAECGLLNHTRDTSCESGVSVCGTCRKVAAARDRFFADLYAPLGRAT